MAEASQSGRSKANAGDGVFQQGSDETGHPGDFWMKSLTRPCARNPAGAYCRIIFAVPIEVELP